MAAILNPLASRLLKEVPLPNAPLVLVIGQVRFSPLLSVQLQEFIAPFQEAIRSDYPILRPERTQGITVGPQGVVAGQEQIAWRFWDAEGLWRVSITPEFIALEATAYTSRGDFLNRLAFVLGACAEHIKPTLVQRLGVRYIDRLTDNALVDIGKLVRKEVLGIVALPFSGNVDYSITQTMFSLPKSKEQILARWGKIPAGFTADPSAIEPIDKPSWVLDVDMFCAEERSFTPSEIVSRARHFTERLYAIFRWAVTDQFLHYFGGNP